MWIVAKIKRKELNIFKKKLIDKFGKEVKFYYPIIQYYQQSRNKIKKIEKFVLENYIFCNHPKFNDINVINNMKFLLGLECLLKGHDVNQNEIVKFIECCRTFENSKGYLTPNFFKFMIIKKAKFVSGPFSNMMFEIIEKQKNKLKILINNIVMTVSDKQNYMYRPI